MADEVMPGQQAEVAGNITDVVDPLETMDLDDTGDLDLEPEVGTAVPITEDGGVVKKILVKGQDRDRPEQGDIVYVHYVGTLASDGSKFDSSRDRNEPFTFNLGEGRVIKGWDLGVATMRRGEKAVLTCRADYAYGASGSPPKIPPGATLDFEVELISWTSTKDIAGDGGVIKTVVTEGTDWQKPDDRDEVTVSFSARVQGSPTPFLSSGPDGVEFVVSDGLKEEAGGFKGITTAVKTMKKGERASLVIRPEYAYGSEGREGVPPNSVVEVDLELLSWKKVDDVTPDGGVVKKTLVPSSEWKSPNEGARVTVKVVGTLDDGTVFMSYPEDSMLTFLTDENQVPEGLDAAVMKMKLNERALVTVTPQYGYGEAGRTVDAAAAQGGPIQLLAPVPPHSTLTYDVTLVEFENAKEPWDMSDQEKVTHAVAKKEKANQAYREGRTDKAITLYDKAASVITHDKTFADDIKAQAKEVRRTIHLNLAAAHIKLSHWKEAASQASKVLDTEPDNVKALYRRAQAYVSSGDYVEAEQDLKRGLMHDTNNADLLALQRKLKVLMRDQAKKESALYTKMFKPAPPAVVSKAAAPAAPGPASDTAPALDTTPPAPPAEADEGIAKVPMYAGVAEPS